MARRPSSRRHKMESNTELDITPIMNLMIVLVPFLLLAAVFSKTAVLNLYLPSLEETQQDNSQEQTDSDELFITVAVTKSGFSIGGVDSEKIPDIKLNNSDYEYGLLSKELKRIKDKYTTSDDIVLLIEPDVPYDVIVHTMDATREFKDGGKKHFLFANVSLADSIILTPDEEPGDTNSEDENK